jgi:hypothetical protein
MGVQSETSENEVKDGEVVEEEEEVAEEDEAPECVPASVSPWLWKPTEEARVCHWALSGVRTDVPCGLVVV